MDHNQQPAEFFVQPQEYSIPEEFPKSTPSEPKKKRGLSVMMVYAFAGVWVLYMLFGYLFPTSQSAGSFGEQEFEENGGLMDEATLPDSMNSDVFAYFEDDFQQAAAAFMEDDYIGAAVTIVSSMEQNYMSLDDSGIQNLSQVYQDGAFSAFDTQDVSGDKGVYLWLQQQTVYYEDSKDGSIYPETNVVITLTRVGDWSATNAQLRILQVKIPIESLYYGYIYCSGSYLQTAVQDDFSSDAALLQVFSISRNDYGAADQYVYEDYVIYSTQRVEGSLSSGKFTGAVTYRVDGIYLNEAKTQMEIQDGYLDHGWIYMLDSSGIFDPIAKEYLDLTNVEYQSDEYYDKWYEALEDPNIYGIYYRDSWDWEQVYLKNTFSGTSAYSFTVYEWSEEEFPVSRILWPWSVVKQFVK